MKIQPIKNENVPIKIMEQIKQSILNKTLKAGDRLPSEREISEKTGVSRTSVREALRSLEMMGLIVTVWGGGSYVNDHIEDSISESLEILYSLSGQDFDQVMQLRRAVEIETVSLAAKRAGKDDVKNLQNLFESIENGINPVESAKFDRLFHYELAKISGNIFFINILGAINNLMTSFIMLARENIIASSHKEVIKEHHIGIIKSIEKNDEKMASKFMMEHIKLIEKYYKGGIES